MLPKKNRLRKTRDIEKVFKNGKTCKDGFLFLKFFKNSLPASRFAFVVGQKISKKATTRNRIKRSIRKAISNQMLNIKPGFDGVWVVLKNPDDLKSTETVVKKILQKAGICR